MARAPSQDAVWNPGQSSTGAQYLLSRGPGSDRPGYQPAAHPRSDLVPWSVKWGLHSNNYHELGTSQEPGPVLSTLAVYLCVR